MKPGDIVSVDQLESSVPGLLGQMTGTEGLPDGTIFPGRRMEKARALQPSECTGNRGSRKYQSMRH